MKKGLRWLLIFIGISELIFSVGFFMQSAWAVSMWPVESSRLSNIFVSSILAAIAAPVLLIGLTGEVRAITGGAINLFVSSGGCAVTMLLVTGVNQFVTVNIFSLVTGTAALIFLGLYVYCRRFPFLDTRPTPLLVRGSFGLFALVLLLAGVSLVLRVPIFPWELAAENSILYGWIFLGNMCYFLYGLRYPVWGNARGQLLAFLAYDLVLLAPFTAHLRVVSPELRVNLIVYLLVIGYSSLLAAYFLIVHPFTRFRARRKRALTDMPA